MHPRQHFKRRNLTSQNVAVKEVGCYSIYGDLDSIDPDLRSDRSLMRKMNVKCDSKRGNVPVLVDFDLHEGFEKDIGVYKHLENEIPPFYQWLCKHADDKEIRGVR